MQLKNTQSQSSTNNFINNHKITLFKKKLTKVNHLVLDYIKENNDIKYNNIFSGIN